MKKTISACLMMFTLSSYGIELPQLTEYQLLCSHHPVITVDVDNYGLVTEKWSNDNFEISAQQSVQTTKDNNKILTIIFRNNDQFMVDQQHRYFYRFAGDEQRYACQLLNQHSLKVTELPLYQANLAEQSIKQLGSD